MAGRRITRRTALAGVLTAAALGLSGCGLGTAGGYAPSGQLQGELDAVPSLRGASVAVGSKNFTEQLVLGKMAVILLSSAGAEVKDYTNIPGSASARQAQLEGQVDAEWEYTGTAWISYLGHTDPIPDPAAQYEAVRAEDAKTHALTWLPPAPMNNTYSFATTTEKARALRLSSLADIKKVPVAQRTFCVESEFASRNDGFRPMLKAYGLEYGTDVPAGNVKVLETGAIYSATDSGLCTFGEIFTTDGRIKALDLAVMKDDKKFFPNYNVSMVVRHETLAKHPQIAQLFAPVTKKLTDDVMIDLNAKVDVEGREPAEVAHEWLVQQGFLRAE
nr:glycine betaine ABC transporter substrate-binding protein [Arsenicicoccus sp. UBA7492]